MTELIEEKSEIHVPAEVREELACMFYERYCREVGGVAFNGDPLPGWAEFRNDPAKQKQVGGWLAVANLAAENHTYAKANLQNRMTLSMNENPYVIVRTYSAGVFAGTLERREGREVELSNARRLWFWDGAASLSQLAVSGTSKPKKCKFPVAVPKVLLTEAIEILDVTPEARKSIEEVPVWEE